MNQFYENQIPVDVFWLDIEYATNKKYFAFDELRFENLQSYVDLVVQ